MFQILRVCRNKFLQMPRQKNVFLNAAIIFSVETLQLILTGEANVTTTTTTMVAHREKTFRRCKQWKAERKMVIDFYLSEQTVYWS